jgi:hypothetical protein
LSMINIKVSLRGIVEALRALRDTKKDINDALLIYSREAMEAFIEDLSDYPSETAANNPPAPFWIRGTGLATNNQGTKINPKSQKLIANWIIAQDSQQDETIVSGRNSSTYAPWVHGSNYQARFHQKRSWQKAKEVSARLGIPVSVIENPPEYPPVESTHTVDFNELTPIIRNPILSIIDKLRQKLTG